MTRDIDALRIAGAIAAALVSLATLMPWATAEGEIFGSASVSGVAGASEGLTIFVIGIVGFIGMIIRTFTGAAIAAIAGLVAFGLGWYDFANIDRVIATLGLPGIGTAGLGVYLSLIAAAALAAIGLWAARVLRSS